MSSTPYTRQHIETSKSQMANCGEAWGLVRFGPLGPSQVKMAVRSIGSAPSRLLKGQVLGALGKNGHGPSNLVHVTTQSSQLLSTLARRHGFFKSSCCLNPGRDWLYIHCTTLRKPPTGRRKDIRSNGAIFSLCLLSKARERPHSCHPHLRPQANRRRARPGPSNPAGVWSARPLNSILCCLRST